MRRMLLVLCLCLGLSTLLAAPALAGFDAGAFRRNFVAGLSGQAGRPPLAPENVSVEAVAKAADFAGTTIYAVKGRFTPPKGPARPFLLYVSADGRFYLPDLVELSRGRSVVRATGERLLAGDLTHFGHVVVKSRGRHVVIDVSDPFCPFCRQAFAYLAHHAAAVSELRLAYFPLPSHAGSDAACELMEWARENEPRKYAAFVHFAFAELKLPVVDGGAAARGRARREVAAAFRKKFPELSILGRDAGAMVNALASSPAAKAVRLDLARARSMGVEGTPVLFVQGVRVEGFDVRRLDSLLKK